MLLMKVNSSDHLRTALEPGIPSPTVTPVMATPAAFAAGVVGGAKASAILVAAAGVGASIAK